MDLEKIQKQLMKKETKEALEKWLSERAEKEGLKTTNKTGTAFFIMLISGFISEILTVYLIGFDKIQLIKPYLGIVLLCQLPVIIAIIWFVHNYIKEWER